VLAKGRRVISRPTSKEEAARGYNLLSGGRHKVYTSVCIARLNKIINKTVTTSLKFKNLSEEEISVLLESAEWRDGANIYSCLGVASAYITWMNGSYTNVMGLPLHEIHRMLSGLGVQQSI
jgi:septum formation protein